MPSRTEVETHVVTVVSGRNEFQMYLMGLLMVSGISILFSAPPPASVQSLLPKWGLYLWAASFIIGGFSNLGAVLVKWHDILVGLRIEIFSMLVLAGGGLVYAIAAAITSTRNANAAGVAPSYIGVGFLAVLFVASVWRFIRLSRWVTQIKLLRLRADNVRKETDVMISKAGEFVSADEIEKNDG